MGILIQLVADDGGLRFRFSRKRGGVVALNVSKDELVELVRDAAAVGVVADRELPGELRAAVNEGEEIARREALKR
jgi:hypothetical protein